MEKTTENTNTQTTSKREVFNKCVKTILNNETNFIGVARAINVLQAGKLWKLDRNFKSVKNFSAYISAKFGFSNAYASQLKGAEIAYTQLQKAGKLPERPSANLCYEIYRNSPGTKTEKGIVKNCVALADALGVITLEAVKAYRKTATVKQEKTAREIAESGVRQILTILAKMDLTALTDDEQTALQKAVKRPRVKKVA